MTYRLLCIFATVRCEESVRIVQNDNHPMFVSFLRPFNPNVYAFRSVRDYGFKGKQGSSD